MIMRSILLITFCLVSLHLPAQDAGEIPSQKPAPPYLAPVPDKLHWIVSFTYPPKVPGTPAVPPPGSYPVSIETVKVGTARHVTVTLASRSVQQFDILGSLCFLQTSEGLECLTIGENYQPFAFYDKGFAFTQCVTPGSFKERTSYQGVPVFHYQNEMSEAWIAVASMLPVGADFINNVKTTYQYLPVPNAGDVALTPAEQKILDNRKLGDQIYKNMR